MSGSTVGGVIGATIGFFIGGPAGAQAGWMIGSTAGAILFPPKGPDGPRLSDLNVQVASYGVPIPRVWGTARVPAIVMCSSKLEEHAHDEGGKGGPSYQTYSYTATFAALWCEGEVVGVRRKWANGKLKYDISAGNTGPVADGSGWFGKLFSDAINSQTIGFTFYPGSETQTVDPALQALKGSSPAYLGYAYSVFEDLELEKYFNALPKVDAEIVQSGGYSVPAPEVLGSGANGGAYDPNTGYLWTVTEDIPDSSHSTVYINDPVTKTVLKSIVIDFPAEQIAYIPETNEFWVPVAAPSSLYADIAVLSAPGMSLIRYIEWSSSAFRWPGAIGYSSFPIPTVYIGSINGVSSNLSYFRTDGTLVGSVIGHGNFWSRQFVELTGGSSIAALMYEGVVEIIDNYNYSVVKSYTATDFGSGDNQFIAYDPTRNRIMWTKHSILSYCYVIDLAAGTITKTTMSPAPASTSLNGLIYHPDLDRFISTAGGNIVLINPDTFGVEKTVAFSAGANRLFVATGYVDRIYAVSGDNVARVIHLIDRLTPARVPVADIITDLTEEVGRTAADIDVTDLAGVLADGVVRTRQGAAQATLEQVLMAYQIDVVESGRKIKYLRRSNRTPVVIDPDEMGLHDLGQDAPTRLVLTRADEVDLPRSVTVKYMNKDADYQVGAQTARRQTTLSRNDLTFELSVVLTDAHALAVAEAVLYAMWAARTKAKWNMSLRYAELEPTDLVSIDGNRIRITKATRRGNMIDCEGEFDSGVVLASGSAPGAAEPVAQTIPLRSATAVEFMDIPLLRDQDDDAGCYVAACGYPGREWSGCVIFKSADGGGTWDEVATLTTAATMGTATTALGSFSRNVFDEFNTVTVRLLSGTLSSISEIAVLNGGNAALIGSEIIQFRTATLNGDGTYTLSGLLRGRKGSPTSGHAIGDRFVLLNTTSVRRMDMATAEIGLERLYKAVSIGDTLASTTQRAFINTAVGLECLSPVQLGGGRNAAGDLAIKWVRRTRTGGEWRDYVDAALGEPTESYEVEIYADGTYTTVKRVLPSSAQAVTYTSAQQVTDFGGNQATAYLRVYQLSATVGRGFPLQGAI